MSNNLQQKGGTNECINFGISKMDVCPTGGQRADGRHCNGACRMGPERPGHDGPNENPHKADNRDTEFGVSSAGAESVSAVSGARPSLGCRCQTGRVWRCPWSATESNPRSGVTSHKASLILHGEQLRGGSDLRLRDAQSTLFTSAG